MDWKEMLEKHGKELAEFERKKKEEWEKLIRYGPPTPTQRQQYREQYWKEYNTLVKKTFFEAKFMLEKERLDKSHLNWLRDQAKAFPGVTHWQERINEVTNKDLEKSKGKEADKDRE
jgi:hypothetical protein